MAIEKDRRFGRLAEERDVPGGETKDIYISKRVRAEIIIEEIPRHTKEGKRLRRLARLAKAYEDAERAVYNAARCDPCERAAASVALRYIEEIQKLTDQNASTPPKS